MSLHGVIEIRPRGRLMIGGFPPSVPGVDDGSARMPALLARQGNEDEPRDWPFIPASALRGALRETFTRLLRGSNQGDEICRACLEPELDTEASEPRPDCPVCRIFGAPGAPSPARLRIGDGILGGGSEERFLPERHWQTVHHVSVDRKKRSRAVGRLYNHECLAAFSDLAFYADVELAHADEKDWELLGHVCEAVLAIGQGRSGGQGRVELRLERGGAPRIAAVPADKRDDFMLEVLPETPLCIGGEMRFSNFQPTRTVIPGSTMRGAIAHAMLRNGIPAASDLFQALFVGPDAARFEDLRAAPGTGSRNVPVTRPVPLSALVCKNHREHGLFDDLAGHLLAEACGGHNRPLPYRPLCPRCSGRMEPARADALVQNGEEFELLRLNTTAMTRVALSRKRGKAARGMLYTFEQIEPGDRVFAGTVRRANGALPDVLNGLPVYVGKGASKGLGRVRCRVVPAGKQPSVAERIDGFMEFWNATCRRAEHSWKAEDILVPLLVTSPWPVGRAGHQSVPEKAYLEGCLGQEGLVVFHSRIRSSVTGRYPVRLEEGQYEGGASDMVPCIEPGGVLVLKAGKSVLQGLIESLEAAEQRGLVPASCTDDERACGLGGVIVAWPFHASHSILKDIPG